jgi:dihydroflavonol-4-reductase
MKTCLVTGAAGFIGSHVARLLAREGHRVRALCLPGEDTRNLRDVDAERITGDVTDAAAMDRAARGCDWVFHLAAIYAIWTKSPERMRRVNVDGTRIVLDAAKRVGVERIVVTSSIARFGGQGAGAQATEESPFALGQTGDLYTRTKRDAHELAMARAREQDVVVVAPTGPLGPGDVRPTPTGRLLLMAVTAPYAVAMPSASCVGDVRDFAIGHLRAAERGQRGEAYLLGREDVSLGTLARLVHRFAGVRRPVIPVPFPVASIAAHAMQRLADHVTNRPPLITPAAVRTARLGLRADCGKSVRELGVTYRPIEESVRDALVWFAREGYLKNPRVLRRIDQASAHAFASA